MRRERLTLEILRGPTWHGAGALTAAAVFFIEFGCSRSSAEASSASSATVAVSSASGSAPMPSASTVARDSVTAGRAPADAAPWRTPLMLGDYASALAALQAIPEAQRSPAMRYALARCALETRQGQLALDALRDLDTRLPDFHEELAEMRARAAVLLEQWDAALPWFSGRKDPSERLQGAELLGKAGRWPAARVAARSLLTELERAPRSARASAKYRLRALLARAAAALGDPRELAVQLRWLALQAPTSKESRAVLSEFADTQLSLTGAEHLSRAEAFARAGEHEECERALAAAKTAGKDATLAQREWLLGLSLYNGRTRMVEAAKHFERAGRHASATERPKYLFYQARALSRADEDAKAVALYARLGKDHPKSPWAEEAAFLAPRLESIAGRWNAASQGLARYLKLYAPRGKHVPAARRLQALTLLAAGKAAEAGRALDALSARGEDVLRLAELRALASALAGARSDAIARWERVIRDAPLTLPALHARAQLAALSRDFLEPLAETAPTAAPLGVKLPPKVEMLEGLGLVHEAEAALSALEAEATRGYAGREGEVLCTLHGRLGVAAERYRLGRQVAAADALERPLSEQTRWLWDCLFPRPWDEEVTRLEQREGLPSDLVYSVMRQESTFRVGAGSQVGATGLLQLMPATASRVAEELDLPEAAEQLTRPDHNLALGTHYLSTVLGYFDGRAELGVAAYNAGPGAVSEWLVGAERLPPELFVALIPFDETREYVYRVMSNWAHYRYLHGGLAALPRLAVALPVGKRAPKEAF